MIAYQFTNRRSAQVLGLVLALPVAWTIGMAIGRREYAVPALLVVLALSLLAGLYLQRLKTPVPLIMLASGLVAVPVLIQLGPASGGGLLTLVLTGVSGVYFLGVLTTRVSLRAADVVGIVFLTWAFTTTLLSGSIAMIGIQNLAIYSGFLALFLVSRVHFEHGYLSDGLVTQAMVVLALMSTAIYVLPRMLLGIDESPRSYALVALVCVAWFAPRWNRLIQMEGALVLLLVGAMAYSLSRTALASAAIALVISRLDIHSLRSWLKLPLAVAVAAVGAVWAVFNFEPLSERFFTGDTSLTVFGLQINGMGRTNLWELTWESLSQNRSTFFWGQGAGSASELITSVLPVIAHPHNDVLRILHDFGIIGLGLWIAFWSLMLISILHTWRLTRPANGTTQLARSKAGVALSVAIIPPLLTDNLVVYSYVMLPTAVLIGLATARPAGGVGSPVSRTFEGGLDIVRDAKS